MQARQQDGPDRSNSQADSAGSIPVTRSTTKTQVRGSALRPDLAAAEQCFVLRDISVPLTSGHQRPGRAVTLALLGLDVEVDRIRDPLVSTACLVLVDQRGALTVVTHPRHQVLEPRAAGCREMGTSMPQVVEVQAAALGLSRS